MNYTDIEKILISEYGWLYATDTERFDYELGRYYLGNKEINEKYVIIVVYKNEEQDEN